jgi:SAM-dependent methyltransferase
VTLFQHPVFDYNRLRGKRVLDIGCGRAKLPNAIGVDQTAFPGVDVVSDLNGPLPFGPASFDAVRSNQVLEHISNMIPLVHESHRVLKPGGLMVVHVPYFRSSWAAVDPTHVRQFTLNSFDYFVRGNYFHDNYRFSEVAFERHERFLDDDYPASPLRMLFSALARRWPGRFENSTLSFLYPFQTLTFVLTK